TVEKERVGSGSQLGQHRSGVSEQQCQRHSMVVEMQAMETGQQRRIAHVKLSRQFLQIRVHRMDALEVRAPERMFLHRYKMQARERGSVFAQCPPGRQEIQSRAKPGFDDRKSLAVSPTLRQ